MIGQRGINDQSNEHGSSIRSTIITFMLLLLNIASIRLNLNEIYTLRKRGNQLTDFDYIVGPAHLRKLEEKAYRKLNHDLEEARVRHRFLDKELKAIENHPLADIIPTEYQEIKRLKHEKLKCKDYIVQLMRKQKNELQQLGKASQSPSIIELGSGGFGKVTLGECVNTKKDVAIKISSKNDYKALSQEYEILKSLPEFGFPKVFHFGQQVVLDGCEHAVMVMDVLGPSLEKLLFSTHLGVRGFKEYTVLRLAKQIIGRLKVLVDHNIVHGDIQPGNFLLGKDIHTNRTVFLIDFGLSSIMPDSSDNIKSSGSSSSSSSSGANLSKNNNTSSITSSSSSSSSSSQLIPKLTSKFGTLQFASAHTLQGLGQTMYKDDMESCAYTLSYLLLGHLPWTHQDMLLYILDHNTDLITSDPISYQVQRQQIIESVIKMKKNVKLVDLCESYVDTAMGEIINNLLLQSKNLQRSDKPDYGSVLRIIDKWLAKSKLSKIICSSSSNYNDDDGMYDWEKAGLLWSNTDGIIKV